ncbi:hypothetical protein ACHWQZ_G019373 [Mnemiopsis leidyi]
MMRILSLLFLSVWSIEGRHIETATPTLPHSSTTTVTSTPENKEEPDLLTTIGEFGIDLTETDQLNTALRNKTPGHLEMRGADIINTPGLEHSVVRYLLQFGYLETVKQETERELLEGDTLIGEADLSESLRRYQRLFGLEVTGTVTEETLRKMREARCGMKDEEYHRGKKRPKRYTVMNKLWRKGRLYYWFDPGKYPNEIPRDVLRREFERSLQLWSDVSGVTFIELPPEKERRADIKISFEKGDHGDRYPFDGPGGIVAHAFFPRKGLLHFDDSEIFAPNKEGGINFHFIATHELGHILGIDHSFHENAVMYPLYGFYPDKVELQPDDKAAAVAAMGSGRGGVYPLRGRY